MRSLKRCTFGTILVGTLAVVALAQTSQAARFPNLYRVTLDAAPSPIGRAAAVELAMSKILVRVTGTREAAVDPRLEPLLQNADRYVVLFGSNLEGRSVVGFSSSLLNQTLTSLSSPIWGRERPLTLLWIAVDDGQGGRAILSANERQADANASMETLLGEIRQEVLAVADERGLPIAFPRLVDLEDPNALSFVDVWSGSEDRILSASSQYRPDAVLVARVRPISSGNDVTWLLLQDDSRRAVASGSIREAVDAVADLYAAEFSTSGDRASVRMTVLDVDTFADYGRVMRYLEGLPIVGTVDVESLDRGVLTLHANARGDALTVGRVLGLGGVLSPDQLPSGDDTAGPLVFRITGQR